MHLSQNKTPSWHPPPLPLPKTLRSLTSLLWKLLPVGVIVALQEGGKVEGVTKATQRLAGAREIKGSSYATSSLAVFSNCLRGLAGSQISSFVVSSKKPDLAWSH